VLITAFLLIVVAAALRSRSSAAGGFRWRSFGPALALTALALQAVRNEPFAMLALLPYSARMFGAAGDWLRRRTWAPRLNPGRVLAAVTIGALLGGAIHAGALPVQANPLGSPEYPKLAAALPNGCRLLNEYGDGGYLILVRPDIPVSQDGRNDLYGSERLRQQERLLNERDPERAAPALYRLGVTCVLLRSDRGLIHALSLAKDGEWHRIARDAASEVWTRTT
jgi:hypothetical protein